MTQENRITCLLCPALAPMKSDVYATHLFMVHPDQAGIVSQSPTVEEEYVLETAGALANAKKAFSSDVLRLIAAGSRSYDAQHQAEVHLGRDVALAEARYRIALSHLPGNS